MGSAGGNKILYHLQIRGGKRLYMMHKEIWSKAKRCNFFTSTMGNESSTWIIDLEPFKKKKKGEKQEETMLVMKVLDQWINFLLQGTSIETTRFLRIKLFSIPPRPMSVSGNQEKHHYNHHQYINTDCRNADMTWSLLLLTLL